jgi:hypothetical protein
MNIAFRFFASTLALTWIPQAHAAQSDAATTVSAAPGCELHVYPTRNFTALQTGVLAGFGILGAVADIAAHKDRVKTVKEVMADILTVDAQMGQLRKADFLRVLNLPADTSVVIESPLPSAGDIKDDPAVKARHEEMEARKKAGQRLTHSTASCYGELLVPMVFYQKAAIYGTRVFTFFTYRRFKDGQSAPKVSSGQVENHTPDFPAAEPGKEDAAREALLHAYGADFLKWASLKYKAD